MEQSDASLVEQCLAGRQEAFAGLVRRHQSAVYNLAVRWVSDGDEAADLAQETFVRAYRKLRTYDPGYAFRNWLLTICANLAKNRYRSEDRRRKAQEAHAELYPRTPESPDAWHNTVRGTLAAMPENLRIPLVLKHVEGLSYEEVSTVLGIGVSAAKMRVKRARDELVRRLGSEREEACP